jgi:hypothetical protein
MKLDVRMGNSFTLEPNIIEKVLESEYGERWRGLEREGRESAAEYSGREKRERERW